jgi:HPt (histidine-containing phosphotransfer) domain-containing protein
MPGPIDDHFAQEATEQLDQLDLLLSRAGIPDPQQLLGLASGVRGSARRVGAETIASIAERLEDAARSIVTQNVVWSEAFRELSRQTIADLKLLVRALNRWGRQEEHRVREAILRWEELESGGRVARGGESVSIEDLLFDPVETYGAEDPEPAERSGAVPIESLILRGSRALEAALFLRGDLKRGICNGEPVDHLIEEVFELIELGMAPPAE